MISPLCRTPDHSDPVYALISFLPPASRSATSSAEIRTGYLPVTSRRPAPLATGWAADRTRPWAFAVRVVLCLSAACLLLVEAFWSHTSHTEDRAVCSCASFLREKHPLKTKRAVFVTMYRTSYRLLGLRYFELCAATFLPGKFDRIWEDMRNLRTFGKCLCS